MLKYWWRIHLLCLFSAWSLALAADTTAPFSFADPTVRIPVGSQDGSGEITLRASTAQKTAPLVTDADLPHPPAATIGFELISEANPQPNAWRYKVRVSGLVPANTSQQHYALVSYGDNKQTIPYVVTNAAPNFSWSISKLPEPWVASGWLPAPTCNEFTVVPKDSPATSVTLGSSTLVEQSTKEAIGVGKLKLCLADDANGCQPTQPINLAANVPTRLKFCTTEGFHGNFHGVVTLTSMQKPDGDTILQSASFSTFLAKCTGLFVLCMGICLAWWSKVWARARLERDQALMPAILMRSQVAALQQTLAALRPIYRPTPANLNKAIQDVLDELTDSALDGRHFLPPPFASPYGYAVDAAAYKAYLEARNSKVLLFSVLVKQGIVRAEAEDNGSLTAAQRELVQTAIKKIDAISNQVPQPNPDQAFQSMQTILVGLHSTLFPAPAGEPLAVVAPTIGPTNEFETLRLQVESISKGVWLVYGVLTALSGFAVLVLNNSGFGTPVDFIFAFFWGFGLPTTIGALAPGSGGSALNISVAKG
jgi:hypothetical protein